jgi:hypothetical protein
MGASQPLARILSDTKWTREHMHQLELERFGSDGLSVQDHEHTESRPFSAGDVIPDEC